MFERCDEFVKLLTLARNTGGKYGRTERLLRESRLLAEEMERLREKARALS